MSPSLRLLLVCGPALVCSAIADFASAQPLPPPAPSASLRAPLAQSNPLEGKPLRYLIGASAPVQGKDSEVTEVGYDVDGVPHSGFAIAYCNLFDEENTGRFGPYLHTSDTAAQYGEGQIDAAGPGFEKNLREQFARRKAQGFQYIELDNSDAYRIQDVIRAIELAASYGFKVIAKNPGLMAEEESRAYIAHPSIVGIIVEKDAGDAISMDRLRRRANRPTLPVWFVAFGDDRTWAGNIARYAAGYNHMGVTYSSAGEYGNAIDLLRPVSPGAFESTSSSRSPSAAALATRGARSSSMPASRRSLAQATPGTAPQTWETNRDEQRQDQRQIER
jgi:hypothetical protein